MGTVEDGSLDLRPGDVVAAHLRIEALLGEGGAGAVYRVRDERNGKRLALKQLRAQQSEHKALLSSHFAREYHTLCQLAHPRIIEVYDYGIDRDCPYYTMELLDGEDLHDRGQLPFRNACALLRDVASSLAIVHARGLIHRDVSARNVRCTSDGRAKLIDFGAMVPAGTCQRAVGTPPFLPPEVLQMQALDARTDLYALGALAYWTLTGRHAYPAQTFNQLRDAWGRPPRRLSDYAADIPEALADLVMSLLRLDRDERPRTAAEVMERLCGIAGLPLAELPQVGRAYLITPSLIGRAPMLAQARAALRSEHGGAMLIEGAPGVGRSRFLDACVLEAKLSGAVVLRGAPADAATGAYGVARALLTQLVEAYPAVCEQTAEPRAALLVHILPQLAPHVAPANTPERRHLQAALRDFFLSFARTRHMVIAIDDLGAIDEPSSALLGALAHGAQRRRLNLLLTVGSDEPPTAALGVLREVAQRIALPPLQAEQTEALLRTLFGDGVRVSTLAARLHPLCGGLPRELMSLAEHLTSRGVCRYESGSWTLPHELADDDLPTSDQEVADKRIAALGPDARELAEALSLTEVRALCVVDFAQLTDHGDLGRTFDALDELRAAGILMPEADRYRLAGTGVLAPLTATLSAQRRRQLHERLAGVLPNDGRSALRISHLLRGGHELDAIAQLLAGEPDALYPGRLDALVAAAEAAEHVQLSLLGRLELHYRVARVSALTGRRELFDRYGWPLIERLRRDSGLLDYLELDPSIAPAERLARSLRRAEDRHDALAPDARGLTPQDSMLRLVALHRSCLSIAALALDLPQIERLGSLEPWANVSPAIALSQRAVDAQRAFQTERYAVGLRDCAEIVQQLSQPTGDNSAAARTMRLGHVNVLAMFRAAVADSACEKWIAELDGQPGYRGNAWRYRMLYQLALGDLERASEYERRAELLDLQDAGGLTHPGITARSELYLHSLADNLTGVKRASERIATCAQLFPHWRATHSIAQAQYLRLQGDSEAALRALQPALELTTPGRHIDWSLARHTQLRLLLSLGRAREASILGLRYLDECTRFSVTAVQVLKGAVAEALAAVDRVAEAEQLAQEHLSALRAQQYGGIPLGLANEVLARVAIARRDAETFALSAERCAKEYLRGRSPQLRARYERLMQAAVDAGLAVHSRAHPAPSEPAVALQADDEARTVHSRMLSCISPAERAERALQLLLEATGARTGYFFALRSGKLSLLFSPEQSAPAPALADMLEDSLERELTPGTGAPFASMPPLRSQAPAAPLGRFIDELGREFEPLVLACVHRGEAMIAGAAALHYPEEARHPPRQAMVDAVIAALIADDVLDPITCAS